MTIEGIVWVRLCHRRTYVPIRVLIPETKKLVFYWLLGRF